MIKNIKVYFWAHLALMLLLSLATSPVWFPVFFVLYGGIQAVAWLYYLAGRSENDTSVSARRVLCAFWLMEVGYTIGLLYVGVSTYCEVTGIGTLAPDCLSGTIFTNPEFHHVMPGIYLTTLYFLLALIGGVVYVAARLVRNDECPGK